MKATKKRGPVFRFIWMFGILAAYGVMLVVVLTERAGLRHTAEVPAAESWLDPASVTLVEKPAVPPDTLLVYDSRQEESMVQTESWRVILDYMDVDYAERDAAAGALGALDGYSRLLLTMPDLDCIKQDMDAMTAWTEAGGSVLFSATLELSGGFYRLAQQLGIIEYGTNNYNRTAALTFDDFVVGGNTTIPLDTPFESSLLVRLTDDCIVHITDDSEFPVPLLWERACGQGRFVVVNIGFNEIAVRGIYAAAYSLLGDACVWPVVNSSSFYIDDFPSPVPAGNGTYVQAEFGRSISSFYSNVWWPDMQNIARKYGLRYTAVIIENYEANVHAPFVRNGDTARFTFFGNSVLALGGELGYHGYNHQPLVPPDFDYHGEEEDYTQWPSLDDMTAAVRELRAFALSLYKNTDLTVYVPPSNILSPEGRQILIDNIPELRGIASLYFDSGIGYAQEIRMSDDGIAEMPRIVSGAELTDYMKLALLSELNLHFYNSHFLHPDDLLDPDRGAALGWTYLRGTFEEYVAKLTADAPMLRQQVGSQEASAIQRYCYAAVDYDVTPNEIRVDITNFFDEAFCLVRIRSGTPGEVVGGSLTPVTADLYLLDATQSHVTIDLEGTT